MTIDEKKLQDFGKALANGTASMSDFIKTLSALLDKQSGAMSFNLSATQAANQAVMDAVKSIESIEKELQKEEEAYESNRLNLLNRLNAATENGDEKEMKYLSKRIKNVESEHKNYEKISKEATRIAKLQEKNAKDQAALDNKISKERFKAQEDFYKQYKELLDANAQYEIKLNIKKQEIEQKHLAVLRESGVEETRNAIREIQNAHNEAIEPKRLKNELEFLQNAFDKHGRKKANYDSLSAKRERQDYRNETTLGYRINKALGGPDGVAKGVNRGLSVIDSGKVDVKNVANEIANMTSKLGPWGKAIGAVIQIAAQAFEMFTKAQTAAQEYVRMVGGGNATMKRLARSVAAATDEMNKYGQRAYDVVDIFKSMGEYANAVGREAEHLSKIDWRELKNLKDFGISFEAINDLDTIGASVTDVSKRFAQLYGKSGQHGLNAKAVSDAVTKNLKMAQNYTFANGVKALDRMAQLSVALKFNMESVARFADKVSTLEGAMQSGAQLSVLGGGFARMGNPLGMLYGGLNDPEQLMDRMLKMTSSMAKWDDVKKQFEITAFNRQRLKAAADATGIDYNDLIRQSMTQARRNRIDTQMNGALDADAQEYVRNIASFNNEGKAQVTFHGDNGEEIVKLLSELTNYDKSRLRAESESKRVREEATVGDILNETRTVQDKLNDILLTLKGQIVRILMKMANIGMGSKAQAEMFGLDEEGQKKYKKLFKNYRRKHGNIAQYYDILDDSDLFNEDVRNKMESREISKSDFSNMALTMLKDHYDKQNASGLHRANGGLIVGPGTSTSDSIKANLSNGEYVVNAEATAQHLGLLNAINTTKFRSNANMNPLNVRPNTNSENNTGNQTVNFQPLNINLSGKLDLVSGGSYLRNIDVKSILTPEIIDGIIKQIQVRTNYALNKDKMHFKFS